MNRDSAQQLRFAIQRLARLIRANTVDGDLPENQRSVVFTLANDGPQSLGSLSDHEHVTPPSMNRTVGCLVDAGLVTRVPASDDARKVTIELSDAGRAFVAESRRRRDAWFTKQLGGLTREERQLLEQATPILRRLTEQ